MSFSDDSELTELTSDEDDTPLASSSARLSTQQASAKSRATQITPHLRPPRTTQYTAKSLYDQLVDNSIDIDPEYQRGVVWSDSKQANLIDSLFHNYYIPPIIFAVTLASDGSEKRTCIDGKQRLTSIQQFIDGYIPHKNSVVANQKTWYTNPPGQNRKILTQQMKRIFDNKQIVCVEYNDLTDDQEREIFQRVQLGVVLTPAERMQAINGPYPSMIRDLRAKVNSDNGFEGYLEWGHARGRDFQSLAQIVFLVEKDAYPLEPNSTRLENWLHNTKPVHPKLRESAFAAIDTVIRLVHHRDFSLPFKSTKLSPVEFVMIGYMVHRNRHKLSMAQLSDAIKELREDVRAHWVDIRFNTKVYKHIIDFIQKKLPNIRLKGDGKGDIPADLEGPKRTQTTTSAPAANRKTSVAKRKHTCLDDSGAEEEVKWPLPSAKPKRNRPLVESTDSEDDDIVVIKTVSSKAKAKAVPPSTKRLPENRKSSSSATTAVKTATKPKVPSSRNGLTQSQVGKPSTLPSAANTETKAELSKTSKPPTSSASTSTLSTHSTATPRALKLSTSASTPTANSGPNSALVRPTPRRSLPQPLSAPPRPPSAPPIEAIDVTMQPPPIYIKPEPRNSPPSLSAGPLSVPPTNSAPDRLAPMRAAKAAINTAVTKVESVTPMGSPSLNLGPPPPFVTRDPRRIRSQGCPTTSMPSPVIGDDRQQQNLESQLNKLLVDVGLQKQQPSTPLTPAPTLSPHEFHNSGVALVPNGSVSEASVDMSMSPEDRGRLLGSTPTFTSFITQPPASYLPPSPNSAFQAPNPNAFSSRGTNASPNSAHQLPSILVKDLNHGTSQPPLSSNSSASCPPPTSASSSGSFFDDSRTRSEWRTMSEREDRRDSTGSGSYSLRDSRDRSRERARRPSRDGSRVWKRPRPVSIDRSREKRDRERERFRDEERERARERGRDSERLGEHGRERVGSWGSYSRTDGRNSRGRLS